MSSPSCPLCLRRSLIDFHRDRKRDYLRCTECQLVFVPSAHHLPLSEEKAIYDLHENQPDDPGYRRFLSRLALPLSDRLAPNSTGLDFGCGPGPLLASMLREQGHRIAIYDPFYADHPQLLRETYDFITCTEVVEHFRHPHQEFRRLFKMLNPNGLLGIMTKLVIDKDAFSRWHYKNDPTHISFFSHTTLQWLANQYHCQLEFVAKDAVTFRQQTDDESFSI